MKTELTPIDISGVPELVRLAEEVRATNQPRVLQRNGEAIAVIAPVAPKTATRAARVRRGKPTHAGDPLWQIVGIGRSDGPTDVASNKHKYLAEAYAHKGL